MHLGVRSFIIAVTSTYLYNNTCSVSGHGHTSLPGNSPPGRVLDVQKEYEGYGQTFLPLSLLDCPESCSSTGRRVGLHRRPCVVITSSYCPDKDAPGITYYALHCGKHGYAQQCPKKGGRGWGGGATLCSGRRKRKVLLAHLTTRPRRWLIKLGGSLCTVSGHTGKGASLLSAKA